jgi:hypothetical protein
MNIQRERFLEKWEKTRAKGKTRYMMVIGLVFMIIFPLINVVANYFQYEEHYIFDWQDYGTKVLIGGALGLFLGLTNWSQNERKYLKFKDEEEQS